MYVLVVDETANSAYSVAIRIIKHQFEITVNDSYPRTVEEKPSAYSAIGKL